MLLLNVYDLINYNFSGRGQTNKPTNQPTRHFVHSDFHVWYFS